MVKHYKMLSIHYFYIIQLEILVKVPTDSVPIAVEHDTDLNVTAENTRLIHRGRGVCMDKVLSDYEIKENSFIHLVFRLTG